VDGREDVFEIIEEEGAGEGSLIGILQKMQERYGYLPKPELEKVSKRLNTPLSEIMTTATFYAQFRLTPIGKYVIKVCSGTACHIAGAPTITDVLKEELEVDEDETSPDGLFTIERVACLGCCSLAPVIMIGDQAYGSLTPDKIVKILNDYRKRES